MARPVIGRDPPATLRGAWLAQHFADASLRHHLLAQRLTNIRHGHPAFRRAQKFPEAASFRIAKCIGPATTAEPMGF